MRRNKTGFIEAAMRNRNIVVIITIILMILGVVALKKMPRNEFPQFTIRQGVIVGVFPGATSAEVEAQLTRVVENYIFGFKEVKKAKTYSQSKEGMMYIFVELNDDVKNADQFWSKLKHGLNEMKATLPMGVLALVVNSDFGDTSALLITLSSDTRSYKEMEKALNKLEADLRKIPAASKIKHYGLQKEKIYVNVKPELLNEYNIKSLTLLGSYQLNGMVNYAGELKDGKTIRPVHLPQNYESEKDLADQIVYSDPAGNVVRLKNIATIERRYEDPDSYIKQNGKKTILVSLEMQTGNNIAEFGEAVDKSLSTFEKQCPKGIDVAKISELPKYVSESVNDFLKEFLIAIVAVILVTMILLPFRVASVAGITVPISVLITLSILYFTGIELDTVSLAALIVVLGMIVDNSIVVIDNYVEKIGHGISPWHAALISARELAVPIITATLAIISAYVPLIFFLPGTAGEFVYPLPAVVATALIISIAVALLLVPYLNFVFIKKGLKSSNSSSKNKSFLERLQGWFDKSLDLAFRHPAWVIGGGVAVLVASVLLFTGLDQQLFPEIERNQFAVEVYLPTGSSLESTAQVMDSLEQLLLKDKRVTNVTNFIGTSSPRFHTAYAPNMPAANYGQLLVNTVSGKATREVVHDYHVKYSDNFVNAHVKWKILAMQLNKSPIEVRISSDSIKDIRKTEEQVTAILKKTKHISWIRNDWDQKQENIRVNLDPDKASRMGYSKGLVSTSLMVGLDGLPLTTIWEDDYPVEVRLSQESTGEKNIKQLEDQYISSPLSFSNIPLRSVATFTPEWSEGAIVHRNGTRTLTIQVDNESNFMASAIFSEIQPQINKLELPQGTTINYGGDFEAQGEVFTPMAIALGLSIVIIFFILLFQFKKEKLALLILSTMLLGLPGAAFGLYLVGYPFSLTAFIGITSLCGMVVRNGIILIDYARELREKHKMPVHEAALAAGKRRMRPIFLTSAAASVGVIPMIMSGSNLWGPLGTVICFGLLISMVLTLYILPILYSLVYSDRPKKRGLWSLPAKLTLPATVILLAMMPAGTQAQNISLDSCKSLALLNNHKIKEAAFEVNQSKEQKDVAFTSYFPKVNATGFAFKSADYFLKAKIPQMNLPVYDGNPVNLATATQFAYVPSIPINLLDYMKTATITATQPIYAGGQIINGNKLAKVGYEINREKQNLTSTEALVRTEELYWTIITLCEKTKTLNSYMKLLDTLHRDVSIALKAGLVQRNDLLKVELKQNEAEINDLKLKNGICMAQRALCQQIGITYDSTLTLIDPQTEPGKPQQYYVKPDQAVSNRSEFKMLTDAVKAEELQKKMTLGENLPMVAVGVAGIYMDAMNNSTTNAVAFATVSIPITDWWSGSHKIKINKARVESARNKLAETSELLTLQIEQANNEVNENFFQMDIARKSVEQARENLKVTNDNYKAGVSSMSDLLEAQSVYQNAMDSHTEARCNYMIKKAKYLQAAGLYH